MTADRAEPTELQLLIVDGDIVVVRPDDLAAAYCRMDDMEGLNDE